MSLLSRAELIDEGWAVVLFRANPAEVHGLMPLFYNDDVPGPSCAVIQGGLKSSEQLPSLISVICYNMMSSI